MYVFIRSSMINNSLQRIGTHCTAMSHYDIFNAFVINTRDHVCVSTRVHLCYEVNMI